MPAPIPKKLVVIGDSGVYGWGDPDQGGGCERLRRHWMEIPDGPVVYNLGVRGDGLERVNERLGAETLRRGELRRQRPQGILLSVGLNDTARVGRPDGRPQLSPDGFLFALEQMLGQAREIAPVMVLGLTPVLEESMPFAEVLWYGVDAIRRYEGLLEDPRWPQWLGPDGLHLNGEGHWQVYERVRTWSAMLDWAGLEPLNVATLGV